MAEKETYIPLSKILSPENEKKNINTYIEIIMQENIPVYCRNNAAKKSRVMPFKVLYDNNHNFWMHKSSWEFFLAKGDIDKLTEKTADKPVVYKNEAQKNDKPKAEVGFGSDYKTFTEMPVTQKVECLKKNRQKLNEIAGKKHKEKKEVVEALVDTVKDAALINRTVLEEAIHLGDDEAKKFTQDIVDSTHEMVKSSARLISEDIFNDDLMNALVQKSNGTIVQHMTRVYLNGIAFLAYYNNLVSSSSVIQKIRISFHEKYRNYYHSLLPHFDIDDITLERVFLGGIKAVNSDILHNWAVGFLIHDIGKAAAVEYHEGEAKYDRNIVTEHVKLGYKSIMTKTNYPIEAGMLIGYHHEYYGDPAGYGYFRAFLQQYKKQNPGAKQSYCITYEKEPILDYQALSYFPAKILEIIDVYDSVTDPNRVYRKAMNPEEALIMMQEEFIEKHKKIDPILFDLFADFIKEKYLQGRQIKSPKVEQPLKTEEELTAELERNARFLRELLESNKQA